MCLSLRGSKTSIITLNEELLRRPGSFASHLVIFLFHLGSINSEVLMRL